MMNKNNQNVDDLNDQSLTENNDSEIVPPSQQSVAQIANNTAKFDVTKRTWMLSLGSALGLLTTACSAPQEAQPNGKNKATTFVDSPDIVANSEISAETHMADCGGATPPPGTAPGLPGGCGTTPVGGGSPGGGTVNPTPVAGGGGVANPAPGTGGAVTTPAPAPVIAPAINPSNAIQTYSSVGPTDILLQTNDMGRMITQTMSDGAAVQVWGFIDAAGGSFNSDINRLCPGPVIEVIEGQQSAVTLSSMHPHTLHLHGLDVDTANDGVPTTSGYVGGPMPGGGMMPVPSGVNLGSPFNYQFLAPFAGTYMYHCHVDTVLHMEMGMSGVVIVRPADGNKSVIWSGGPVYDREYIWQLHTFDSRWHNGARTSGANTQRYSPNYFMINGRDGGDLLTDSATAIQGVTGERILIRLINLGYMPAVFTLGSVAFDVVASDGRPMETPQLAQTQWLICPGERYDVLFDMPVTETDTAIYYSDIMGLKWLGQANSKIKPI